MKYMEVHLKVKVRVHEPEVLLAAANRMAGTSLDHEVTEVGEAVFEVLIGSNGTPEAPLDLGIELADWTVESYAWE